MLTRPASALLVALAFLTPVPAAQSQALPADTAETFVQSILEYPASFHLRQVIVYGTLRTEAPVWWLETDDGPKVRVAGDPAAVKAGRVELVAEAVDVGRLPQSDPRMMNTPLQALLIRMDLDRWPRPGELVVLVAQRATVLRPAIQPSVRALVLESERFVGKTVSVVGRFRARNVFNDLPAEPGADKYQFVIRSGRAAVWVVGLRPRINGVDLDLKSRTDTDRWLAVEGVVRRGNGLVWIEATRLASAPTPAEALPPPPPTPQLLGTPEVMFSLPAEDEEDVAITTKVRIQYTRPIDPSTLTDRVRVTYAGRDAAAPAEPAPPFVIDYATSDHVVTLRFRAAFERFRTVTVELLDGIATATGTRAVPWKLTFTTGGQE